jgi:hypothetical protein
MVGCRKLGIESDEQSKRLEAMNVAQKWHCIDSMMLGAFQMRTPYETYLSMCAWSYISSNNKIFQDAFHILPP